MGLWRKEARRSRKEKIRNLEIRETTNVVPNIIEVTEKKKTIRWFGHLKMRSDRIPKKNDSGVEWQRRGSLVNNG